MLNIPCVFASLGKQYDDNCDAAARNSRILGAEWIPLVRCFQWVLHLIYERVKLGPLTSLLAVGNWDEVDPENSSGIEGQHLLRVRETWAASDDAGVYNDSVQLLRKSYAWVAQFEMMQEAVLAQTGYNRSSGVFIWLHSAPERYFVLLKQPQPAALLIFAYFGALLHGLDGYWWLQGWGKDIVTVVDELLGTYWRPWTEWSLQVVGWTSQQGTITADLSRISDNTSETHGLWVNWRSPYT